MRVGDVGYRYVEKLLAAPLAYFYDNAFLVLSLSCRNRYLGSPHFFLALVESDLHFESRIVRLFIDHAPRTVRTCIPFGLVRRNANPRGSPRHLENAVLGGTDGQCGGDLSLLAPSHGECHYREEQRKQNLFHFSQN